MPFKFEPILTSWALPFQGPTLNLMHALYYVDLIKRAVADQDTETLDQIGRHLEDCEEAKQILRAKGYGTTGMAAAATARMVPVKASPVIQQPRPEGRG